MTEWVIAEWIDEDGPVRAPSYQGINGKWYRAGVSDYGGPTILLMDSDPVEVTKIQGASPQRRSDDHGMRAALYEIQVRQAAIGDSVANLAGMITAGLNRIERDLARSMGRESLESLRSPSCFPRHDDPLSMFGPPLTYPVLATPQEPYVGPMRTSNPTCAGALTATESAIAKDL